LPQALAEGKQFLFFSVYFCNFSVMKKSASVREPSFRNEKKSVMKTLLA